MPFFVFHVWNAKYSVIVFFVFFVNIWSCAIASYLYIVFICCNCAKSPAKSKTKNRRAQRLKKCLDFKLAIGEKSSHCILLDSIVCTVGLLSQRLHIQCAEREAKSERRRSWRKDDKERVTESKWHAISHKNISNVIYMEICWLRLIKYVSQFNDSCGLTHMGTDRLKTDLRVNRFTCNY